MQKYWFFEKVNLFKILCPHKFKAYANEHKFLNFKKDEYIYLQGETSKTIFLINSGTVKMGFIDEEGNEIVTAYLKKGELFGEEVVLDNNSERNEFAQSGSNNTSLCGVTIDKIEKIVKDNKSFSIGLYKFIDYRFKRIERRYKIMFFRNTKNRILEFFKDMKEIQLPENQTIKNEISLQNPYSQAEIAKLIATSRQNFNSLIKELEEEEYLEWQKNKILLKSKFLSEF